MSIFNKADILLPECIDMKKWSVVACDQYTAQPEYWKRVEAFVGDSPSTLNIVYPEAFLSEGDARIEKINSCMKEYCDKGLFAVLKDSLIYIERTVNSGKKRCGIIGAIDLEKYDYSKGAKSAIRATEGTILERIPPRVKIRKNAPLELPHAILLLNDSENFVLGGVEKEKPLYDFDLMEGGGHIAGWHVMGDAADAVIARVNKLAKHAPDNLVFAVGDGNHSLATAKACWEELKPNLTEEERAHHPARFCLVEVENIHDEALEFEPIHRVVFGKGLSQVKEDIKNYYDTCEDACDGAQEMVLVSGDKEIHIWVKNPSSNLTVGTLQKFLDDMKYKIDYIHGDDVVRQLSDRSDAMGFILPCPQKSELFETVILDGALPRKTFSMGEANEKRFYLEAKKIV